MDWPNSKCCPNCSQFYQIKYGSQHSKPNLPLLLTCGHSMCEKCLQNVLKSPDPVNCKICNFTLELQPSDVLSLSLHRMKLYELFPINVFMLGELTLQNIGVQEKTQVNPKNADYYIDLHAILKSTDTSQGECLECHRPTTKMCRQCATVLCETCFNKTHKNFVIFKNHVLSHIESSEPSNCKIHKDKPLDYFCKDCSKSVCMDCMMVGGDKFCKNHDVVSIQEVNDDFIDQLGKVAPKVDETFKRLTKTGVDIGNLLYNIENNTGAASELINLIIKIEQHFSKLSAGIQKHKNEVIGTIHKLILSEKESLQKAKSDVANNISASKKVLNTIRSTADPNKLKQLNLAALLEEANQIVDMPWYLGHDKQYPDPHKVVVNDELCELVKQYVRLDDDLKSTYKLRSLSEIDDSVTIPPPPNAPVYPPEMPKDVRQQSHQNVDKREIAPAGGFYKFAPTYRSKSGSVSSLNSVESYSSNKTSRTQGTFDNYNSRQRPIVQTVPPFEESHCPRQLTEGSQELIYISHIENPHNFYVQRACNQKIVKDMLREFKNATSWSKPSIGHVTEGKVFLMFNKTDNMWQRARVIRIDRKNIDAPVYQMFSIDFGSTETATIDKLRNIPPARVQMPLPLAINCSLANCDPKNGSWTCHDSILIQNIIDNKQAIIHIRRNYADRLECDVTTFEEGVSVAHALVFHNRATLRNPGLPYPKVIDDTHRPKIFMNNNDYKPKSTEEVHITHIVSPDKFYVRKQHLQSFYENLCEELEQEYSLSVNTGKIYLPEIEMVCVVNMEKYRSDTTQGAWARAIVKELPGKGRVRVLLPDSGLEQLVHWSTLRYIHNRFTTARALATECYLAGITPLNKKWSSCSVVLLEKYADRPLELLVEDCRSRGALGVTLFYKEDPDNEVCINKEMIKAKFAVSFGIYRFNNKVEEQVITKKSPLDKPKVVPQKPNNQIKILKKQQPVPKSTVEQSLEAKHKGPLRLQSKLLYYQSPSMMYFTLNHQDPVFEELYEDLRKYYSNQNVKGRDKWAPGERCATFSPQSQTWRRAVVIEVENENAKVFYCDFACSETVPLSSLKELPQKFASIGDAAVRCHLCGVIPAVGDEWPSLTKEFLKELIDAYPRIFITKLGNYINGSIPIELWVFHTIQGGALEPNQSEWRCLNQKIIDQGLGIPDKRYELTPPTETETNDDTLSFLNLTGSVRDWLQLEPMPTKPLITKDDSEGNSPIPQEFEDEEDILKNSNTVFISDWLPPEPLQNKEFAGVPTYIDNDGMIYLHDVSQQDTLDLIRKALEVKFKNPDPKSKYAKWTVGEPCIALYFLDNCFYRGRIIEVNNETSCCIVQYIDYGNEESCSFVNLRKSIALHQIPTQAHRCVLDRIRPIGDQWDRQTLDYLHKSIVEKECLIKVTGENIDNITPIDLKYNKLWINDHLVDFEMALYANGKKAVVRKFAPLKAPRVTAVVEPDSEPDYLVEEENDGEELSTSSKESHKVPSVEKFRDWNEMLEEDEDDVQSLDGKCITYLPNPDTNFLCNITIINDKSTLELNVIHNDETNILYEEMFAELQRVGPNMSPLNGIFANKACLALFNEDDLWYRASILEYSESKCQVKVRYVDHGNIAIIPLADAREISEKYVILPPSSIRAKLCGITLNPDISLEDILREYSNTFLGKGPFQATVVGMEDTIPIVELKDDENKLVYDHLIEKGIFKRND